MENKQYIEPDFQIIMFEARDIITISSGGGGGIELPDDEW